MAFHLDCWTDLHQHVQQDYSLQVESAGLTGLLGPYSRTAMTAWLPATAIDVAAETLAEMVADDLAAESPAGPVDDPVDGPVEEPVDVAVDVLVDGPGVDGDEVHDDLEDLVEDPEAVA
jgi:hypothetical protein